MLVIHGWEEGRWFPIRHEGEAGESVTASSLTPMLFGWCPCHMSVSFSSLSSLHIPYCH